MPFVTALRKLRLHSILAPIVAAKPPRAGYDPSVLIDPIDGPESALYSLNGTPSV
jgi:hypothetical protein